MAPWETARAGETGKALLMSKITGKVLDHSMYVDGGYLEKNPEWHADESPFKVTQILRMVQKNDLKPKTICEVGCGVGEVLKLLQEKMDKSCSFWGYEISPQALELCKRKANERLQFKLADISQEDGFLKGILPKSELKVFHFPLDLSVQAVARKRGLLTRRELYGHLQYFTKETALETLRNVGYEILDYFYTPRCIELAKQNIQKIAILPRKICFAIHPDLAVRILGGYSLLVLAK
jgi:SAM-dependent methyltransferase